MHSGDTVADRFEIERRTGVGGMGTVFRARDRVSGEAVALKVLHTPAVDHADRFAREAQVLAQLHHPGIVRYVSHGHTAAGMAYLAMEWLEGEDLARRLVRQPLTLEESTRLGMNVADALSAAHARGIVHRDLKPANLFLVGGDVDRVKILDFGVARLRSGTQATTNTGAIVGTPGYIAPEQARGAREIDARADLFALGCVLFTCITGKPAFAGESAVAVLAKILFEQEPRVRELRDDVPSALDDLVARMMAKDRALRPRDASEVSRALASITSAGPPSVRTPSIVPKAALTEGERRLLSVILAGDPSRMNGAWVSEASPAIATEQPPERLRAIIHRHGGSLELLANGVMVITLSLGATATDQAAQGARCALAMREILEDAAIAVATGHVEPSGAHVPVGEVIDRAAALLSAGHHELPPPGRNARSVRIDEVTARLLDARFDVGHDPVGPLLYGERWPLEMRKLLGKRALCVGRDRELGLLGGIFDECVTEPVARAVLVLGAPGVGKSRLCHEFLARVRDRGVDVWVGLTDAMSSGSPFGMVAQALRRTVGLFEGEALDVRQQKLRARVARHVPEADVPRVAQFLGELVGTPFPDVEPGDPAPPAHAVQLRAARKEPRLMGDQMCRAWEDFVAAECEAQPVLLVLDDLHWGDLPSVKLVDAALRSAHERPFMVLAFARPEVRDLFPRIWKGRGLVEIELGELSPRASERLVRSALGDRVGPAGIARIVARAGGNAFYLEELIRAEAEGKGATLPETVLAMLERRLERLEPEARRILRAASIFGEVFAVGGVKELVGGSSGEKVAEWLEELVERELLVRHPEGRFPGEPEYAFRHALVREAAYAMLTDEDRALGHKLAGHWLEQMGERDAVALGEHFERGGESRRAIDEYRRAAENALEGNDFAAVIARAERAIACGADGVVRGLLRQMQAEAHAWRGEVAEVEAHALDAVAHLPPGTAPWFAVVADLVRASMRLRHRERAVAWVEALCEQVPEPDALEARVIALARATPVAVQLNLARVHQLLDSSERMSLATGRSPLVEAWRSHGRACWQFLHAGNIGQFVRANQDALAHSELVGDVRNANARRHDIGYGYLLLGLYAEAEHELLASMAAAERMGLATTMALAQHNLGLVLARRGDFDGAIRYEQSAIEAFEAQGDRRYGLGAHMYLARILLLAGNLNGAEREARLAETTDEGDLFAYAGIILASVQLARGDARGALGHVHRTLTRASSVELTLEDEAHLYLVEAEALHAAGEVDAARAAIIRASDYLLERADKIEIPEWRESFLWRVPENARTLSLARAWRV